MQVYVLGRLRVCQLANFVDLLNERLSNRASKSRHEVNDSLLEGKTARVNRVHSANLSHKFERTLPNLGVLMQTPLAGELSQLLVIGA